jgi:2-octaprenyl-6-methoxyphenol hydroxylase
VNEEYDLMIVGGGLAGVSLALALASSGLRLALIEAAPPRVEHIANDDDRAIALSLGSARIFQGMGLWQAIAPEATPIRTIHVSERGGCGFCRLDAGEMATAALGYVITARALGGILLQRLAACGSVDVLAPARLAGTRIEGGRVRVEIQSNDATSDCTTRLLVAADGGDSPLREALGLPVRRWEYRQHAVIANLTPSQPHRGRAYERFTPEGPIALLPLDQGRCALVWTVADADVQAVLALDDAAFLQEIQRRFGWRLGRFSRVGRRSSHALRHVRALESVGPRTVLIGNAAHSLHPIAGQGFNLGLRDVAALAEAVTQAGVNLGADPAVDPGSAAVLAAYRKWREGDQQAVAVATDSLVRLFGNPLDTVRWSRNLALTALDLCPPARRALTRAAMGMAGRQPRLARGVPLD